MLHFLFSGGVCERGGSVSPLVSSVPVLLAHLHAAQARPVFPVSPPHLRPSLPAAAPGVALVSPQHLRLPRPDVPPRRSLPAPSGRGARRGGRFDRDAPPGRRESVPAGERRHKPGPDSSFSATGLNSKENFTCNPPPPTLRCYYSANTTQFLQNLCLNWISASPCDLNEGENISFPSLST